MNNNFKSILLVLFFVTALLNAQTEKKMSGSLGVSYLPENNLGHDLQFSYALKNKLSATFQSYSLMQLSPFDRSSIGGEGTSRTYNIKGSSTDAYVGFNLGVRYYFKGDNTAESDFTFYGGAGLGFILGNYKSNYTTELASNDTLYYDSQYDTKERTLTANLSLGVDKKIGPGKLYAEIPFMYHLYGSSKWTQRFTDEVSTYNYSFEYSGSEIKYGDALFFLNLGYRIQF
ncbi:MAG: hypothetical protein ACK5AY_02785 [Bacteroidota bacterium]|jgi:hypothetical protein